MDSFGQDKKNTLVIADRISSAVEIFFLLNVFVLVHLSGFHSSVKNQ